MRRLSLCGTVVLFCRFLAPAALGAEYRLTDLSAIFGEAGTQYQPRAINDAGLIVGTYDAPPGDGFLNSWVYDGTFRDMGSLLAGGPAQVLGLNEAGKAVGFVPLGTETRGFLYDHATRSMTPLGFIDGTTATVGVGINNQAQVVGYYNPQPGIGPEKPFRWENGVLTPLATLSPDGSNTAGDINDAGLIIGSHDANSVARAVIYRNGVPTDIGTLGGPTATAMDINQSGQVIGQSRATAGEGHAFLYQNGTMVDLGSLGRDAVATALNDAGTGVGYSFLAGEASFPHAVLYRDGMSVDLNTLIDTQGGRWSLTAAYDVNNAGQIVGVARYEIPGQFPEFRAVLLTPVPEPAIAGPVVALAAALCPRRFRPAASRRARALQ
jgi:probable HAF family extracellular repeat protein